MATLTHTYTVSRAAETADPLGGPVKTWVVVAHGAGRLATRGARAWSDARAAFVTASTYTLLTGAGAELAAGDRVTVTLGDGTVVGPLEVKSVLARRGAGGSEHHRSVELERLA